MHTYSCRSQAHAKMVEQCVGAHLQLPGFSMKRSDAFIWPAVKAESSDMMPRVGTLILPLGKSLIIEPSELMKD